MLSSVLRGPRAVQTNMEIMRAFVRLRRMLQTDADLAKRLDALEAKYDGQFKVVFQAIREPMSPPRAVPPQNRLHDRSRPMTPRARPEDRACA